MERQWEALCAVGMPDGAVRSQAAGSLEGVRDAVCGLRHVDLSAAEREVLLAWLRAFQDEFSHRFQIELGDDGAQLIDRLERLPFDVNHYLKLRRIAVENLSRIL